MDITNKDDKKRFLFIQYLNITYKSYNHENEEGCSIGISFGCNLFFNSPS